MPESEKVRAYRKAYRQRPEVKERRRNRARERYATDPAFRQRTLESRRRYVAERAPRLQTMMRKAKAGGCIACDEKEFVALDFHHLDPATKSFNVGMAVYMETSIAPERFAAEIAKCVVLCVNCHRKHHAGILELPDDV